MRGRAEWGFDGLGVNLHGSCTIPVSRCRFVNFRYRQHPPPPVKFPLPHKKNEKNEKKRCGAHISSTITTTTHTHNLHPTRSPFFIRSSLATQPHRRPHQTQQPPPSASAIITSNDGARLCLQNHPTCTSRSPLLSPWCRLLRYRL
jgi:hypothetical protein